MDERASILRSELLIAPRAVVLDTSKPFLLRSGGLLELLEQNRTRRVLSVLLSSVQVLTPRTVTLSKGASGGTTTAFGVGVPVRLSASLEPDEQLYIRGFSGNGLPIPLSVAKVFA